MNVRSLPSLVTLRVNQLIKKFAGNEATTALLLASATAILWIFAKTGGSMVVRLSSNFFMTRLLEPEAFGLAGIAFATTSFISILGNTGLGSQVIRHDDGTKPYFLRTVWTVSVLQGACLFLIVQMVALVVWQRQPSFPETSIWSSELTAPFIAVAGCSVLLNFFSAPRFPVMRRELDFKTPLLVQLAISAVAAVLGVAAAFAGAGPWALMIAAVSQPIMKCLLTHLVLPGPRMWFQLDRTVVSEIFHFGKWIMIATVAHFISAQGDRFIFSGFFNTIDFSLYVIAGIWSTALGRIVGGMIGGVCMPALAKCRRENPHSLTGVYRRFRFVADLIAISSFVAFVAVSKVVFEVFYTDDFAAAQVFIPMLAFRVLFSPYSILNELVLAAGDSRAHAFNQVCAAAFALIVVPLVFKQFGPLWAIFAFSCTNVVVILPILHAASKEVKLSWRSELPLPIFGLVAVIAVFGLGWTGIPYWG